MKVASTILFVFLLAACTPASTLPPAVAGQQNTPVEQAASQKQKVTAGPSSTATVDESLQVTAVVEDFGKKLQQVSLLSPTAGEDIHAQYADFVAPELLEHWAADPSKAPGRVTSSPWPDHIEVNTVQQLSETEFKVEGEIIELTSVEVNAGSGTAVKIPVEMILQKVAPSRWMITEFK